MKDFLHQVFGDWSGGVLVGMMIGFGVSALWVFNVIPS